MAILGIIILAIIALLYAYPIKILSLIIDPFTMSFILLFSLFSSVAGFGFKNLFKAIKIGFSNSINSSKEELITSANVFKIMFISSILSGVLFSIMDLVAIFFNIENMNQIIVKIIAQSFLPVLEGILISTVIYLPLYLKLKNNSKIK